MRPRRVKRTGLEWLVHLLSFSLFIRPSGLFARAFTFEFSAPGQCDPLNISWTGGSPPFSLLIAPLFRNFLNISLPSSVYNVESQSGSFETHLSLPEDSKFLLAMSDADGFGSGGISDVLRVGSSATGSVCNIDFDSTPAFTFVTPDQLQQCSEFVFDGYSNSTQPNIIRGLIPLGQAVTLVTNPKTDNFTWQTNVAAGTSMVFIVTDSLGRGGGTSDIESVLESSNAACLNEQSPHSTAISATPIPTTQTPTSQSSSSALQSNNPGVNTAAVAGIVIGAVAILLIGILVVAFFARRRKRSGLGVEYANMTQVAPAQDPLVPGDPAYMPPPPILPSLYQASLPAKITAFTPPSQALSTSQTPFSPFGDGYQQSIGSAQEITPSLMDRHSSRVPSSLLPNPYRQRSMLNDSQPRPDAPSSTYLFENPRQSGNLPIKASSGLVQARQRLVLHNDADDPAVIDGEQILELPPQYADRRTLPARLSDGERQVDQEGTI